MKYDFKCKKCNKIGTFTCNINEIRVFKPRCPICGSEMTRVYNANMIVPDSMKAANIQDMSAVNSSLDTLPSGKKRAIY